MSPNKRIAYWMSDKKSQKVNWDEFQRVCSKYGFELFKVNLNKSLKSQEPFVVFLHKLTDIIALANCGDDSSINVITSIESYLSTKRDIIVIDPIDKVRQLLNRYNCYSIIKQTELHHHGVFTPNFCEITARNTKNISNQLKNAQIHYPFICKPPLGHGSKKAHEMMLIFNEDSLFDCPVPCVAQSFINHNAVLYKIFIIGGQYYQVRRPSLKNFYPCNCESIIFDSSHISKAGAQSNLNTLDPIDDVCKDEVTPDDNVIQRIVHTLRSSFGMDLLGVDVVIENKTGLYGIVDVNAYPGYDGYPDLYENLLKCIDAKVQSGSDRDKEIDDCFQRGFQSIQSQKPKLRLLSTLALVVSFVLLIIYVLLYVHQPTSSVVLRNVQSFIYPGFKVVRYLSMPIISFFPSLTALYDESCLIENPYFQVSNLDCYPCEGVHSVINLTGITNHTESLETGTPFIILDNSKQKPVRYEDIIAMYKENIDMFNGNAPNLRSNNSSLSHIRHLLDQANIDKGTHISWRINRMDPARVLRKLFPRPVFMSEWSGQSIERYMMIDGQQSEGYLLPGFECGYVFVIQGSGERNIILKPTTECRHKCRTISVVMKASHTLWYNWWYWKPLSLPTPTTENSTNISISYISSYC